MAKAIADIRSLARAHTEAAIGTLAMIMRSKNAPPSARVAAAGLLLERGWGRPVQPIAGEDGNSLEITFRHIVDSAEERRTVVIEHSQGEPLLDDDPSQGNAR